MLNPFLSASLIGEKVRVFLKDDVNVIAGVFVKIELLNNRHYYVIQHDSGTDHIPVQDIELLVKL